MLALRVAKAREIKELRMGESGPEKAGVGGSIPSLATSFQQLTSRPFRDWLRLVALATVSYPQKLLIEPSLPAACEPSAWRPLAAVTQVLIAGRCPTSCWRGCGAAALERL